MRSTISLVCMAVCGILTHGCHLSDSVRLKDENGKVVNVPRSGPYFDAAAVQVAEDIYGLSKNSLAWKDKLESLDPEARGIADDLYAELRYEAISELDFAFQTARQTSGPVDSSRIEKASEAVRLLKSVIESTGRFQAKVRTVITARTTAQTTPLLIQHCLNRAYRQGNPSWSSYNSGQIMEVGRYHFRVWRNGEFIHDEKVLVLDNPTKHELVAIEEPQAVR